MKLVHSLDRRLFLSGMLGATTIVAGAPPPKIEEVHRFATEAWDIRMTVEFHDRYSSHGFVFDERFSNRQFCLSGKGEEGSNCPANFVGSLAIARYQFRPRAKSRGNAAIRELVRTIDEDSGDVTRKPFERTLSLASGVVSDIQAFGYEAEKPGEQPPAPAHEPWRLLRQDLYVEGQTSPFLVIHWKHTLSAIRMLDLIPGDHTWIA